MYHNIENIYYEYEKELAQESLGVLAAIALVITGIGLVGQKIADSLGNRKKSRSPKDIEEEITQNKPSEILKNSEPFKSMTESEQNNALKKLHEEIKSQITKIIKQAWKCSECDFMRIRKILCVNIYDEYIETSEMTFEIVKKGYNTGSVDMPSKASKLLNIKDEQEASKICAELQYALQDKIEELVRKELPSIKVSSGDGDEGCVYIEY